MKRTTKYSPEVRERAVRMVRQANEILRKASDQAYLVLYRLRSD
jgi:transposase-like protein